MQAPAARAYYHYRDGAGTDVIVDRFEDVPPAFRGEARQVDGVGVFSPVRGPTHSALGVPDFDVPPAPVAARRSDDFVAGLHWPSLVVGGLATLVVPLVVVRVRRRELRLVKALALLLLVAAGTTVYLTFVRREAGLADPRAPLAPVTPRTVVDDARQSAASAQRQQADEAAALKQIEELSR